MKTKYLLALCLISMLILASPSNCDSTLFNKLIDFSNETEITESEFLSCKDIVDTLDKHNCDYFIKNDKLVTSLTFLLGTICYKVNSDSSIKAFLDYHIKHINSAEEQISFSFENLFTLRPKLILEEILKADTAIQKGLLGSLAWGFLNNRAYGTDDPFADNPFNAMTAYNNPPDPILNKNNYKEIYYLTNPETKNLYSKYPVQYNYIFNEIVRYFDWRDKIIQEGKK